MPRQSKGKSPNSPRLGKSEGLPHTRRPARPFASATTARDAINARGADDRWSWLPLIGIALFHLVALRSELATDVPSRNDLTFHLLMVRGASDMLASGGNPLDFWMPQMELGFPQFLYYQHLPHLLLAVVHRLTFGVLPLELLFHGARVVLLLAMPFTVFASMRMLGFARSAAVFSAMVSMLLSANNRMGLEYNSYVLRGFGLFTQLVAVHLTFVALALLSHTLETGRRVPLTAVSLACLVLSHLLFGTIILVISILLVVFGGSRDEWGRRILRLTVVGLIAAALCSYLLFPFVQSSGAWLSSMPWVASSGAANMSVARIVLTGGLIDHGRWPVLAGAVLLGVVLALRQRDQRGRFVVAGLLVCTLLYIARPDGSWIGSFIPVHAGFITYRFVSAVGIFAILAVGYVGERLWWASAIATGHHRLATPALYSTAVVFLLLPALAERWRYYADERAVIAETRDAMHEEAALAPILAAVDSTGGRAFAGPVTTRTCAMHVGPSLCVSDLLRAQGTPTMGNPLQNLALPSGLTHDIPVTDPAVYDLFDVRSVIVERGRAVPPFFMPKVTKGRYTLYGAPTSGTAAYVSVSSRRHTNRQDTLFFANEVWFRSADARARRMIRWDYPATPSNPLAFTARPLCSDGGRTRDLLESSQHLRVEARCAAAPSDTVAVMLKMSFHPQWEVRVDDRVVQAYMVSPGFLAVDLPVGTHTIDARYTPHPAKLPLLLLGLVVLTVAIIWRRPLEAKLG